MNDAMTVLENVCGCGTPSVEELDLCFASIDSSNALTETLQHQVFPIHMRVHSPLFIPVPNSSNGDGAVIWFSRM